MIKKSQKNLNIGRRIDKKIAVYLFQWNSKEQWFSSVVQRSLESLLTSFRVFPDQNSFHSVTKTFFTFSFSLWTVEFFRGHVLW